MPEISRFLGHLDCEWEASTMGKISVLGTEISYYQQNENDYISLTDMVRNIENGLALIEK